MTRRPLARVSDKDLLKAIHHGSAIFLHHAFDRHVPWDRRFDLITQEAKRRNLIGWSWE